MKRHQGFLFAAVIFAAAALAPAPAQAVSSYYTTECAGCHGSTPTTCNGCHQHAGTVKGALAKTSFAAGETMTVTVTAGSRTGWWKAAVLDEANNVVGTGMATATGAVTVAVPAPAVDGSYSWKVAWYGNKYGVTPGAGWVDDQGNGDHGYQTVALPAFTVSTVAPPPPPPPPPTTSCTDCHATPPDSGQHALHAGEGCGACHGGGYSDTTADPGTHQNGIVDLASSAGWDSASRSCANSCHGTQSWGGTPPPPPASCTGCHSIPPATGQHTLHSGEGCGACHGAGYSETTVEASTHANGAVNLGPDAGWTASSRSCSNGCHGNQSWGGTTPTGACSSCHAMPPSSGEHTMHGSEDVSCRSCHGSGYSTTTVNATTHNDGAATLVSSVKWNASRASCSNSCHGTESWGTSGGGTTPPPTGSCTSCHATPPSSGEHALHAGESVSCASCHGSGYSKTTVNAATHQNGAVNLSSGTGWNASRASCSNSCHGTESWGTSGGGTTPPPSTGSCTSCHATPPTTGEHAFHGGEGVSCANCHGNGYSKTTVNAATHQNGAVNLSSAAGWNASRRSCSNSCHGTESWGSGGTTPPPPSTGSCTTCHKIPPSSGEHSMHASEGVACGSCHGTGYSKTAVNAATHNDGKVNLSSRAGFNASRRTCSNSCHGSESWVASSGGGDNHEEEDFVVIAERIGGGSGGSVEEEKAAGGCSSAGSSVSLMALLGVALLGLRRRRTV